MTKQNSHNQSIERVRSFSRAPQLSSRSVSASAAETAAGRLGRRTGMPAASAAAKAVAGASHVPQRVHEGRRLFNGFLTTNGRSRMMHALRHQFWRQSAHFSHFLVGMPATPAYNM